MSEEFTVTPYRVAKDTYVIPQVEVAPPLGYFYINSMVIRGKEPVIVDTGTELNRDDWLAHAWSLVNPKDVRWIFLSHDDPDHTGNLMQVLEACPKAQLVTTWFSIGRMTDRYRLPLDRCVLVNDGDSFEAGDRRLVAVRPPYFDGPTTRGLFDTKTRAYWAVDSFVTLLPHPTEDAGDLLEADFREGMLTGQRMVSPWHTWLDEARFGRHIDRVQKLGIETIAAGHAPAIHGRLVTEAFDLLRTLPGREQWQEPTDAEFKAMLESIPAAPAA